MMDVFCAILPYFVIRSQNISRRDKRNLIILMGGSVLWVEIKHNLYGGANQANGTLATVKKS